MSVSLSPNEWFTEIYGDAAYAMRIDAKLEEVQTPFQQIAIYQSPHYGYIMAIDGCNMLNSRDNFFYHEMMAHPILFTHAAPKRVAIIGGGDCGVLQQVLRHESVEQVRQIDIDEQVTRLAEKYFPELCTDNGDPRAEIAFEDGVKWLSEQAPGTLDVLIVDSTDPVGPAEGLFSEGFYREAFRVLGEGGLVVQQCESPILHPERTKTMHQWCRDAGFSDTLSMHYPQPCYPSGTWSAVMARKGGQCCDYRREDVRTKSFSTRYYNESIHEALFAVPEFLR